jgi:ankyrin repeat protein
MTATLITGNTPLHNAALNGDLDKIKSLIEEGEDVDGRNDDEETALHLAARKNAAGVIQALCQEGKATIDIEESAGKTPLYIAVQSQHFESVKMLLECGADPQKIPWYEKGTLLHLVARPLRWSPVPVNRIGIFHLLLPLINPNIPDNDGHSALHIAVQHDDNLPVIKEIVFHPRIDLNLKNHAQETPLDYLAKRYNDLLGRDNLQSFSAHREQVLAYMKVLILAGADTKGFELHYPLIWNSIEKTVTLRSRLADYGPRVVKYLLYATKEKLREYNLLHNMLTICSHSLTLPSEVKSIILEHYLLLELNLPARLSPCHPNSLVERPNQAEESSPRPTF